MHSKILLLLLSLSLFLGVLPTNATVLGSITFESGTYGPWITGGATHTYLANGGWDGHGAAQFTVPTSADSYSGISLDFTGTTSAVYIRWVQKTATNFHHSSDLGKHLIVLSTNGTSNRAIVIDHECDVGYVDLTLCAEIECEYQNTQPGCIFSYECTTRPFNFHALDGIWIAIEVYANRSTGAGWIKVTTQDGSYNQIKTTQCDTSGLASSYNYDSIQILGTYGGVGGGAFILDDLVVADAPIGPPAGFLGDGGSPSLSHKGGTIRGGTVR